MAKIIEEEELEEFEEDQEEEPQPKHKLLKNATVSADKNYAKEIKDSLSAPRPKPYEPKDEDEFYFGEEEEEIPRKTIPQPQKQSQRVQPKQQPVSKPQSSPEQKKVTFEDLIAALQNHEQRLTTIESALFRLKGAI